MLKFLGETKISLIFTVNRRLGFRRIVRDGVLLHEVNSLLRKLITAFCRSPGQIRRAKAVEHCAPHNLPGHREGFPDHFSSASEGIVCSSEVVTLVFSTIRESLSGSSEFGNEEITGFPKLSGPNSAQQSLRALRSAQCSRTSARSREGF